MKKTNKQMKQAIAPLNFNGQISFRQIPVEVEQLLESVLLVYQQ